jgi:hypothetical protein
VPVSGPGRVQTRLPWSQARTYCVGSVSSVGRPAASTMGSIGLCLISAPLWCVYILYIVYFRGKCKCKDFLARAKNVGRGRAQQGVGTSVFSSTIPL